MLENYKMRIPEEEKNYINDFGNSKTEKKLGNFYLFAAIIFRMYR